jgi:hypothetical protein
MDQAAVIIKQGFVGNILAQLTFTAFIKFFLNYFKRAAMGEIFSKLIFLQYFVLSPLIAVKFPGNSMTIFGYLNEAATFDILQTDDWFPTVFGFQENDLKPYNK